MNKYIIIILVSISAFFGLLNCSTNRLPEFYEESVKIHEQKDENITIAISKYDDINAERYIYYIEASTNVSEASFFYLYEDLILKPLKYFDKETIEFTFYPGCFETGIEYVDRKFIKITDKLFLEYVIPYKMKLQNDIKNDKYNINLELLFCYLNNSHNYYDNDNRARKKEQYYLIDDRDIRIGDLRRFYIKHTTNDSIYVYN